jgi:hypothetical protein
MEYKNKSDRVRLTIKRAVERMRLKRKIKGAVSALNRKNCANSDVYLFGTGEYAQWVLQDLDTQKYSLKGYFDNNSQLQGTFKNSLPVDKPRLIENASVIIVSSRQKQIWEQLLKLGYSHDSVIRIDRRYYSILKPCKRISWRSFGYLPRGDFSRDFREKLSGTPNLLKRLQARDIIKSLALSSDETV